MNSKKYMTEEQIDIIRKFKIFLKKEGVFYDYLKNCYLLNHGKHRLYTNPFSIPFFQDMFKRKLYTQLISSSFIWIETPQGYKFWERINDKWHEKYNIIKRNERKNNNSRRSRKNVLERTP